MLSAIARFEIRNRLLSLSTWVYIGIFFVVALLFTAIDLGVFSESLRIAGSAKIMVNSPYNLMRITSALGVFGLTIMATIMGRAVQTDFEHRTLHFFFTSPITKFEYLGGRFAGAFAVVILVFVSIGLGIFVATHLPGINADRIGSNHFLHYLWPYLVILLPNAFLIGGVFFMAAALTRKMLPVYVGSAVLLLSYLFGGNYLNEFDNRTLAALVDPFGTTAISRLVEYWTIAERNTQLVPLTGLLLWNRLLWFAVAAAAIFICYRRFGFAQFPVGYLASAGRDESNAEKRAAAEAMQPTPNARLVISPDEPYGMAMLPRMVWINFAETVKNIYFGVLVLAGLLMMVFVALQAGRIFGTNTWPLTFVMVERVAGGFALFMTVLITFYAGELTWRERDQRLDQIIDATAAPPWLSFVGKLLALMMVPLLMVLMLILSGVIIQIVNGYYRFELSLYLKGLFAYLVGYWILCAIAMVVHSVVNNKYLSHFLMIAFYFGVAFIPLLGYEHYLYRLASVPGMVYSDMNGFGHYAVRQNALLAYWSAGVAMMLFVAYLFWQRGVTLGWRERLRVAQERITRPVILGMMGFGALFIAIGAFIFYNTNVLNDYETSAKVEKRKANYEKTYKVFAGEAQPQVTAVKLHVDLFPQTQSVRARGSYRLINPHQTAIDTVHLDFLRGVDVTVDKLEFSTGSQLLKVDSELGVSRFKLARAMQPGDVAELTFEVALLRRGFVNEEMPTDIVRNGSFLVASELLPQIGYQRNIELTRDGDRKKFGLAPRERKRDRDDGEGLQHNVLSNFAHWVDFSAVVSTEEDQLPIAPGYVQREWTDGGRRYVEFKSDTPILNSFAFQSARYDVKRDRWSEPRGDVALEIYHHPTHTFNLDSMMAASKASLTYMTNTIGPYPHRQLRIVEFPRYRPVAAAFANTIPYSEGAGFIARVDAEDEKDIDYPYYLTAHETAHQWWGLALAPANVQGASMLSESLAQYSALMVMKERFGDARMKRFLAYELDRYLSGRAFEQKKEVPLGRVEDQQYIHYSKGSLAMYALQDYIGEANVNRALKQFYEDFAFKGPPYPNATILIKRLREVTPPEYQYVIDDMFENIIVYENLATAATYRAIEGGQYEVRLSVQAKKRASDALGKERDVPIADWIDIGVLDDKGVPLFLEKRKIEAEKSEFVIVVGKPPAKAGIDPLNKLIDRRPKDNVIGAEKG
jgi:ABC-2 type transport system permease protein